MNPMRIRHCRRLAWLWLAVAPLGWSAGAGMEVWAIGDSVRIDPIRSQAFEDNHELFPDGIHGNYKQSNLVWDAGARRVSLKAARNETVAFQIVIERTVEKLSNIKLALGELIGPNGARIPAANVDLFREWYVHVKTPSKTTY